MYLREELVVTNYTRQSKLGVSHEYTRTKRTVIFRCDSCGNIFSRDRGKMDPKRLSNNYFHCCSNCDSKKFAQERGSQKRTIWNKPVSCLDDISKI
jgi:DNA-directed RNA polymerase subunit RPC12/RpoP